MPRSIGQNTLAILLLASVVRAKHPVREEIIEEIRLKAQSWIPMALEENHLRDIPEELMHMKLGIMGSNSYQTTNFVLENTSEILYSLLSNVIDFVPRLKNLMRLGKAPLYAANSTALPDAFDARDKWPPCIHGVRDQQLCGSCWAFASSGFLSDRFCIHSEGDINVVLAPQDLVACNFENFGCNGGMLTNTVDYLMKEGIVSETCMPYQDGDSFCDFKCINKTEKWTKYYCKEHSMQILSDPVSIQTELMTNGPMMVGLTVYEDFMNYKSGIYKYTTGNPVGGHAIKLIGWGHEAETGDLYWVCQNQWGTSWGDNGFLNIKAGQLGLDSMVLGCLPDIQQ